MIEIPFNRPARVGNEISYIEEAIADGKISGNGRFSKACEEFFEKRCGFRRALLTTSCTDALELSALLLDIKSGDEVIVPSYTFVSTANAFALRGAKLVFADSEADTPNLDTLDVGNLVNPRTRAIVPVHYAGVACDMDPLTALSKQYNLAIVEDAAQAVESFYRNAPLGSIGAFGAFSFHETKNVICGEGGMLAINASENVSRAEVLREKGTNRAAFFRGEVDKYRWVDIGSSFLPSELNAAYLLAQLEKIQTIQEKRLSLWQRYHTNLLPLRDAGNLALPHIPPYATNNAHMFYVLCESLAVRDRLISHLKQAAILSVFHYLPLHQSPFYLAHNEKVSLPNAERYSDCLLRLPLYYDLTAEQVDFVSSVITDFYR